MHYLQAEYGELLWTLSSSLSMHAKWQFVALQMHLFSFPEELSAFLVAFVQFILIDTRRCATTFLLD